jgi:CAAX protease family protein
MQTVQITRSGPRSTTTSLLLFFVLVFVLTIPFLVLGALTGLELLPGLPVASLGAVCPTIAAVIVVYRDHKAAGVAALLKRAFDFTQITAKVWYIPTLLLMPLVMALSFGALRLAGVPVPIPRLAVLPVLLLCVLFFISALAEELGWSGYATDPLQERWGALWASLALGVVWAIVHYAALLQAHRSVGWIAWWSLFTVAARVLIVWLYNNTGGSVFVAALFHMMINVTWQLFPVDGSYYDPRITGMLTAAAAVIVVVIWGPRTLARYRFGAERHA